MLFHSLKTNKSAFSTPRFPFPNFTFHVLEAAMETMELVAAKVAEEVEEMMIPTPTSIPKIIHGKLVEVTTCVFGVMASRPNFGLNELDFVFSTLIVNSILNFTLMYLLAPTTSTSSSSFSANCP
ncbi:hypothetical protein CRYUN_Cryun15aG0063500 [Craigia yunnanensis]